MAKIVKLFSFKRLTAFELFFFFLNYFPNVIYKQDYHDHHRSVFESSLDKIFKIRIRLEKKIVIRIYICMYKKKDFIV